MRLAGLRLLIRAAAVVACALAPACARADTPAIYFRIPSKPVAEALVDFALQARVSIGDAGLHFDDRRSTPVEGRYTPREALARLLAGTGFDFDIFDAGTIRIRRARPSNVSPGDTETVVVTATKRRAVAQDLPYSISVTSGVQLAAVRAQTPNDLTAHVAGLTASNLGAGEDKFFVRGLSDSVLPGMSESMVGLYLDEARITDDAPDPDLRLVDIDRVEVLRGPQGSLYGAGSLGGLIRIIPNAPVLDEWQAGLSFTTAETNGGAPSYGADAMINIPLARDRLALRAVAYDDRDGGYLDDIRLGLKNANRTDTRGGRMALAYQPNAIWSVTLSAAYQDIHARDAQYFEAGQPELERDNFVLEPQKNNFFESAATVRGNFGSVDLVSASSVVMRRLNVRYDATDAWNGLTGLPEGPAGFDDGRSITSLTQEFRLSSDAGTRWTWLAGLYLSHRNEDFNSDLTGPDGTGAAVSAEMETRADHADDAALFGEASYAVVPQFTITVGGRVFLSWRKVSAHGVSNYPAGGFTFSDTLKQSGATPKFVATWRPNERLTIYGQVSEGYRLGGFNVDGPAGATNDPGDPGEKAFDSDSLWNYEIGAKAQFWDGRIQAAAAAYFAVWNNVQSDQVRPDGTFFIVNAGKVHDLGFETDVSLEPFDGFKLAGNLFFNNTQLIDANPLLVKSDGVLPGAPDISYGLSARYDLPWKRWADVFFALDYSYVGRSNLNFDEMNSPTMGGYHITNARIGIGRGRLQLILFADNLANERKNTFAFGNPFDFAATRQITPPRPRTVGVTLEWTAP